MAKKCTSNFFGVPLQCCWLSGSDCNWFQHCDYPFPSSDNRKLELASSYRQFQCVHYLYREYQCIVLYLFPPSILIAFIIFIVILRLHWFNSFVSFNVFIICIVKICVFLLMLSITRHLNVLFLQGYFSISTISPTPTSLPLRPENWRNCLLLTFYGFLCWCFLIWECNFLLIFYSDIFLIH